jgi:hypothetical protein
MIEASYAKILDKINRNDPDYDINSNSHHQFLNSSENVNQYRKSKQSTDNFSVINLLSKSDYLETINFDLIFAYLSNFEDNKNKLQSQNQDKLNLSQEISGLSEEINDIENISFDIISSNKFKVCKISKLMQNEIFYNTKKEDDIKTTEEGTGIKRGGTNVGDTSVTGTTKPGTKGGSTVKSDAEKQQINEARIKDTKEKYYKLMGIDKMNKDAVYDSLIDASKIVSEEGADLKGSIRSGNLQNRIIQAISQNLDKSADLKKQIDAAILKGEIEKDIKANDPAAAVDLAYKKAATAKIEKDLKGPSAADLLLSAKTGSKNLVTSGTLENILSSLGTKVDFTFPDDKYQKWEKNNEGKDEIDYLTENYGGLDDGTYIVNEKAFTVKDGSVFEIDLDKIVSKS